MDIIQEDLSQERTLQNLTTAILLAASVEIFDGIKSTGGNFAPGVYSKVYMKDALKYLDNKIPYDDQVLQMAQESNIPIYFMLKRSSSASKSGMDSYASYMRTDMGGSEIIVYITMKDMQELNSKYKDGHIRIPRDVYVSLYYMAHSYLLHELKHYFDDVRTKGKIYQTKQAKAYFDDQRLGVHKNIYQAAEKEADEKVREELLRISQDYLNLPHEIWARYSQAMDKVRFVKLDIEDTPEGGLSTSETMIPLPEFVGDFKRRLEYLRHIQPKHRRRMLKAAVKAWHEAKDFLDKYGTFINPNNVNLSDQDYLSKRQTQLKESEENINDEILDKVKEILSSADGVLMPNELSTLADEFDMPYDKFISIARQAKLAIDAEKYDETSEDIQDFIEEISKSGVNVERASIDSMLAMFNELHNNHHIDDLGVSEDTIKELLRFHSRGGKMVAESVRVFIQKTLQEALRK